MLGWYAEGIEEKVQHVPDMESVNDHYSPSFKRVEDVPSREDIIIGLKAAGCTPEDIIEELVANGYPSEL